jgi:hypothetical protein
MIINRASCLFTLIKPDFLPPEFIGLQAYEYIYIYIIQNAATTITFLNLEFVSLDIIKQREAKTKNKIALPVHMFSSVVITSFYFSV